MGIGISVEGLTKSFGSQRIWEDVTMEVPEGEVSVLLGPSGTGKSVFLKSLIGLLRPERGSIVVDGTDITECSAKELYDIRTLFGVMFQDGALFGSMNLYDNTAFPLREHTKKKESEIRDVVMEKLELVGLGGDDKKFPGEISGGMRKRAGLARSLVLDPKIILCDEPDSGLDPVRTAYLSQLLIDINAQIDCTILIVTHNINIARTVPDNMGMLFRRKLVMFGPREVLLTSDEPVVKQFLNGRRIGPIGMSEEKDEATMAEEQAHIEAGHHDGGTDEVEGVPPQITATPGYARAQGRRPSSGPGAREPASAAQGRPRGDPRVLRNRQGRGRQNPELRRPLTTPRRRTRHRINPDPGGPLTGARLATHARQEDAMARHRLETHIRETSSTPGPVTAQTTTSVDQPNLAALQRHSVRVTRASALSVAMIAPLVLACAVSGEARFLPPRKGSAAAPVAEAAVVSPTATGLSGPILVAVARRPVSLRVVAVEASAQPPAALASSTTTLGIPAMALSAYRNAEQKIAVSDPSCGISWNLLAGIGRIESGHASGGATDARGTAVRPIYGPALDGTLPGNEIIVQQSAASGITFARAMGPMQFLPGTWARYAADGDGDGVADPQNLYDSALAAARYLCSGNLNLRESSQTMTAILRYNNSVPYARNVLGWAAAYAAGVVPVDLPPISGAAPPLGDTHLENPEGLGPGMPLNLHGLPSTDPLTRQPLIDFGQPPMQAPTPPGPSQIPGTAEPTNCTLICIGR